MIEIGVAVTDGTLSKIVEGPNIIINCPSSCLKEMDKWYRNKHSNSGLIQQVRRSKYTLKDAEPYVLDFLKNECGIQ